MNKRTSNIICLLLFVLISCFFLWKARSKQKIIQKNFTITSGNIYNYTVDRRGFKHIEFSFYFNDRTILGDQILGVPLGQEPKFLNKAFPVVFSNRQPEVNEMLVFPGDFERYDLKYPDSLKWAKDLKE